MKYKEYEIKKEGVDFFALKDFNIYRGTRLKHQVIDKEGKSAFFKYPGQDYQVSESASEKLSYEIANILGYNCAKIEFAYDSSNELGILNYFFVNNQNSHVDAVFFLKNDDKEERQNFYTISNIKSKLDLYDKKLFGEFIKIMVFDALIGEQDRHEKNLGITIKGNKIVMSPIYDNGCSLLREFKNTEYAEKYYSKKKSFEALINKSKTYLFKENHLKRYKHFELIKYLLKEYYSLVKAEIINLKKLSDDKISLIVNRVPDTILTSQHKDFIVQYIIRRRDILLNLLVGEL